MDLPMNALTLPDIAAQASRQALPLDWVGMCGIALPILIDGQRLTATADAGVSLDDGSPWHSYVTPLPGLGDARPAAAYTCTSA